MSTVAAEVVPCGQGGSELTDAARRVLLDDALRGLPDIAAGRTEVADAALARLQHAPAHRPKH
jgi:hypothetical protein